MTTDLQRASRVIVLVFMTCLFVALAMLAFFASHASIVRIIAVIISIVAFCIYLHGIPQHTEERPPDDGKKNFAQQTSHPTEHVEQVKGTQNRRILLIDDNREQAMEFAEQIRNSADLKDVRPTVDVASSHKEFLEMLPTDKAPIDKMPYDAIFSDLYCPTYKDGIDNMKVARAYNAKLLVLVSGSDINDNLLSKIATDLSPYQGPDLIMAKGVLDGTFNLLKEKLLYL